MNWLTLPIKEYWVNFKKVRIGGRRLSLNYLLQSFVGLWGRPPDFWGAVITLAIIKVTSGYKFQTAAYRTDFS